MREVTPIDKLVYEKEADEIGGMVILINGEPGAGKTMALTRMVMKDLGIEEVGQKYRAEKKKRIPLWTGQDSCQWILPAAQGIPVTLWIHESIKSFQFMTTGSREAGIQPRKIDLTDQENLELEIKRFEDPSEIVDGIDDHRLNVYYIPGSNGGEKDKYFFQDMNYQLGKALNDRKYRDHITLNVDEVQNVAPDYSRRPFYDLQMQKFPTQWQDFRKNNVSMRGTSHGYSEINWKYYDLKANGIIYMQGGRVHKNHSQINQGAVNNMKRGECVAPGFEAGAFEMPVKPQETFPWIADHPDVVLTMDYKAEIPDTRPQEVDVEEWLDDSPFEKKHLDDIISVSTAEAELLPWTSREIRRKLSNGDLPGVKTEGKWLLSRTQLLNLTDVPIAD